MSYDPTIGRWTQEDPIAFEGGDANLYRYVGNGPTNYTDPTGLEARKVPNQKDFWKGDVIYAEAMNLPAHLLEWARDSEKIDVYTTTGATKYNSHFLYNNIYINNTIVASTCQRIGKRDHYLPGGRSSAGDRNALQ